MVEIQLNWVEFCNPRWYPNEKINPKKELGIYFPFLP
jgi:hypothetical protein